MSRVLVAGCGYVGSALADRLVGQDGHEVWGLRRSSTAMPDGVHAVVADLSHVDTLTELPRRLDAVVYAVGADGHTPEQYERAYVEGLANLWQALRAGGDLPRRLVLVSSTAVYAQNDGAWVDETSPTEPQEFSGRTLLRSEALARSLDTAAVVVRFGGIYGPGRTRFVDTVRNRTATLGEGTEYTNRIHRLDCAGVLAHLLRIESPAPIYIGVDDEPADRRAVVEWLARRLDIAPPPRPASPDSAAVRGKRCSNRALRASGYAFQFPSYREGYENVITAS